MATAYELGWSTVTIGDLIRLAEQEGYELLITTDTNLRYKQNLKKRSACSRIPSPPKPGSRRPIRCCIRCPLCSTAARRSGPPRCGGSCRRWSRVHRCDQGMAAPIPAICLRAGMPFPKAAPAQPSVAAGSAKPLSWLWCCPRWWCPRPAT